MKNLKLAVVAAFFTVVTTVNAQDKINNPTSIQVNEQHLEDNRIEKFKDQLNLTSEQKAQIKEIRGKREVEKRELKKKLKDLRVAERIEINSILTTEQQAIIKEKKELKSESFKGRRHKKKQQ